MYLCVSVFHKMLDNIRFRNKSKNYVPIQQLGTIQELIKRFHWNILNSIETSYIMHHLIPSTTFISAIYVYGQGILQPKSAFLWLYLSISCQGFFNGFSLIRIGHHHYSRLIRLFNKATCVERWIWIDLKNTEYYIVCICSFDTTCSQ